jgi:hypothetical protein
VRIYKLRAFVRFQRKERLPDLSLIKAIRNAEDGLVDADLGGGLIKQRIARAGQGKSGGYRTVVAFRLGQRAVFLFGFAKNERSNIDGEELREFKRLASTFLNLSSREIASLVEIDELTEVNDEKAN